MENRTLQKIIVLPVNPLLFMAYAEAPLLVTGGWQLIESFVILAVLIKQGCRSLSMCIFWTTPPPHVRREEEENEEEISVSCGAGDSAASRGERDSQTRLALWATD